MSQLGGPELGLPTDGVIALDPSRAVRADDGKFVVLAGDLDTAADQVLDGMVGAVVPERKLVGLEPNGPTQDLVTEADSVDGETTDEIPDRVHDVVKRPGISGSVAQKQG